jgi:hypothetical protein
MIPTASPKIHAGAEVARLRLYEMGQHCKTECAWHWLPVQHPVSRTGRWRGFHGRCSGAFSACWSDARWGVHERLDQTQLESMAHCGGLSASSARNNAWSEIFAKANLKHAPLHMNCRASWSDLKALVGPAAAIWKPPRIRVLQVQCTLHKIADERCSELVDIHSYRSRCSAAVRPLASPSCQHSL